MFNETHKAVRGATFVNQAGSDTGPGSEVKPGDTIYDFRGEPWVFLGITRVPNGASTGRVYVDGEYKSEFFPSVFDLTIVQREPTQLEYACCRSSIGPDCQHKSSN